MGIFVRIFTQAVVWGAGARLGCEVGRRVASYIGVRDAAEPEARPADRDREAR